MSASTDEQGSIHELTYHKHEEVEDLEGYSKDGYHPVTIGDVYMSGRYRIVHKLGWGSYSTVWLARDSYSNRYVALKILVAGASQDSTEGRILRHLQITMKEDPGSSFVASLLDEFHISGPNGHHLCIATEPARGSVGESKEDHPWMFSLDVARAITAQAVFGLGAIHRAGVIHGDLHPRNILFTLPHIDSLSVDEIYQQFQTPRETKVHRVDGAPLGAEAPPTSVMPAQTLLSCDKVKDPRISIADFGESWLSKEMPPRQDLNTPVVYLPPESTFAKDSIGFPADVWTLACSIYEIMGERVLFEGFFPDRDDIIAEMVSCLGPLPQHWWDAWDRRGDFFLEDGSWRTDMERCHDSKSRPLAYRIQGMGRESDPGFCAEEAKSLEEMLRSMFEYEPAKRASVKDVAESDWMVRWGCPSLHRFGILP